MKKCKQMALGLIGACLLVGQAIAHDPIEGTTSSPFQQDIRSFVEQLTKDNNKHLQNISREHFKSYAEEQNPRATVVSCSDSRVQSDAFHQSPINDLFFIRNIGNQIQTTEGSVEYGIDHLKTPILLIIGHSQCGAIHTAMGDYSKKVSKSIKKELDTLDLLKGNDTDEGVMANIHNQVHYAMNKFKDKIDKKELIVIGAIYDFADDFGHGHGKMIVIDVNGDTDAEHLKAIPMLQGISGIAIGEKRLKPAPAPEKSEPATASPAAAANDSKATPEKVSK